jgi:PhnB protein
MLVQPYLFFEGRCEEALEFYKKAVGAEVTMLMRNKDNPEPQASQLPPGNENKVMHSEFKVGESTIMGSDGYCRGATSFQGFSLAISVTDPAQARKMFDALGEGGKVDMPLAKTFFSESFGMLTDKFGIGWILQTVAK